MVLAKLIGTLGLLATVMTAQEMGDLGVKAERATAKAANGKSATTVGSSISEVLARDVTVDPKSSSAFAVNDINFSGAERVSVSILTPNGATANLRTARIGM